MDIKIYFGKIVDINDDKKLNRIRMIIPGKTEIIHQKHLRNPKKYPPLPWYHPILGMDFIPEVDDELPVIIFNDNFCNGMYLKKIPDENNYQVKLSGDRYKNYLEIFNRKVKDKQVQLTYDLDDGIQFKNDIVHHQTLTDLYQIFVGDNHFKMTEKRFDLGTDGEATPLGDKTVAVLLDQLALSNRMYKECMLLFQTISVSSFMASTLPIKAALNGKLSSSLVMPEPKSKSLEYKIKHIQSKKTFIE